MTQFKGFSNNKQFNSFPKRPFGTILPKANTIRPENQFNDGYLRDDLGEIIFTLLDPLATLPNHLCYNYPVFSNLNFSGSTNAKTVILFISANTYSSGHFCNIFSHDLVFRTYGLNYNNKRISFPRFKRKSLLAFRLKPSSVDVFNLYDPGYNKVISGVTNNTFSIDNNVVDHDITIGKLIFFNEYLSDNQIYAALNNYLYL